MIPAAVIVDSRNVHGQIGEVLGRRRLPEVRGIVEALRPYGFEAAAVYVGVGMVDEPRGGSKLSPAMAAAQQMNAAYTARVSAHPLGNVLEGRLVEREGLMEEKKVDVHCALQVYDSAYDAKHLGDPARGVVVVSKDIDISPAYSLVERKLGVPVYAMAANVVHTRPGRWLLASQDAFATMASIGSTGQPVVGAALRDEIVGLLTQAPSKGEDWRAPHLERRPGRSDVVVLRHARTGILGVAPTSLVDSWSVNDRFTLAAMDVDLGVSGREFPRPVLGTPGTTRTDELQIALVERWIDPTLVRAKSSRGSYRVNVHPGAMMIGDEVLVRRIGGRRAAYIGTTQPRPHPARLGNRGRIHVVTLVGTTKLGDGKVVTEDGIRAVLRLPQRESSLPGSTYAAVLVDVLRNGAPLLSTISSALPSTVAQRK